MRKVLSDLEIDGCLKLKGKVCISTDEGDLHVDLLALVKAIEEHLGVSFSEIVEGNE